MKISGSRAKWAGAAIVALSGLIGAPAQAASITMYVAYGSGVSSYTLSGTAITGLGTVLPTPVVGGVASPWSNAFAVVTDTSGNIYVADSGNNRVVQYTSAGVQHAIFNINADTTSGNISPQEIALDASGNLWVTSLNGSIYKFASASTVANGSTVSPPTPFVTIPTARGILINGATGYVSTSALGSANVYSFNTSTGVVNSTPVFTSAGYPAGQLRGLALDSQGTLYLADTSWDAASGYVDILTSGSTTWSILGGGTGSSLSGLSAGPNDIQIANKSGLGGGGGGQAQHLYVADYFTGTVNEYLDNEPNGNGTIGTLSGAAVTLGNGLHATGLAFGTGAGALQGAAPAFFDTLAADEAAAVTPEPSTIFLVFGALLVMASIQTIRRRSAVRSN